MCDGFWEELEKVCVNTESILSDVYRGINEELESTNSFNLWHDSEQEAHAVISLDDIVEEYQEVSEVEYFQILQTCPEEAYQGILENDSQRSPVDADFVNWIRYHRLGKEALPDISQGLGKKQENRDLVTLEAFILMHLKLKVYQGELIEFDGRHWCRLDVGSCSVRIRKLFRKYNMDTHLTAREYQELYKLLLINPNIQQEEEFVTPQHCLNLSDGTLDIKSMTLYPHNPSDGFFSCLEISSDEIFEPSYGLIFEQFADDISGGNPDVRKQLLELVGLAITGYEAKVFYVLLGPSNTGKTQFGRFLAELLGHNNVVSVAGIHELGSRFALSSIENKNLCLCLDLPDAPLPSAAVGVIKQAIGDDALKIEAKYKNAKTVYQKPLFVFASNHPVRLLNMANEQAFLNRMITIPFSYAVPLEKRQQQLYQLLLSESSYIIANAINAYRDLLNNNFMITRAEIPSEYAPRDARDKYIEIESFIDRYCIEDDSGEVSTNQLYELYQSVKETSSFMSKTEFSRYLSSILPKKMLASSIKRTAGKDERGYRGVRLIISSSGEFRL